MENRTGLMGFGAKDKLTRLLRAHKKGVGMLCSLASGYVMASSHVFGGIAPFGVAFCATLDSPYAMCAALGAVLGYTFTAGPLTNMKYLAAVVLVVALKWLFGSKVDSRFATAAAALTATVSLGVAGVAVLVTAESATLYDALLCVAEVLLGTGAAYFFSRTLRSMESGWQNIGRSDISCLIVSFAVVIMGFSSITIGGLSVGRMLSVLIILLCARSGWESGGAVAGLTAGIAMGFAGGDYAYAIAAYGFGGLLAGVFSSLGRIATAGSFIIINTVAALFTQTSGDVYTSLFEIFVASVVFIAVPQSAVAKLRLGRMNGSGESDASMQAALKGRLGEISGALVEISSTTREVGKRLGRMEGDGLSGVQSRVADRVCAHCGMKTTCWQFKYAETTKALNDAMGVLKREGSINRERMPKYFTSTCCRLEDFVAELNTQFQGHVAKEGVQRKVGKVRRVVTDQFEGMAMMLDEITGELCNVTVLEEAKNRKVQEYFRKGGLDVQQVRCYKGEYERVTVEVSFPEYQVPKLHQEKSALDLSALLDAEFDRPYVHTHQQTATACFTEKADFVVEMGAYQITPEGNRLCGDAYETILNRAGKAHFIISDGMGSGGNAAVDSHMASVLLARLISVGFSHEAALKMVNSALLIKSGEESLATIDVCTVDLYTGHTDFYKAGAAPTFVIRGGRAGYVESTSLPAGILQGVAFDKSGLSLRESDVVVMVSDGVIATGTDWVKSELETNRGDDMQRMAEKLAMTAKIRRTDGREDDITVLAMALRRGA